jgi:hypothetical protein
MLKEFLWLSLENLVKLCKKGKWRGKTFRMRTQETQVEDRLKRQIYLVRKYENLGFGYCSSALPAIKHRSNLSRVRFGISALVGPHETNKRESGATLANLTQHFDFIA